MRFAIYSFGVGVITAAAGISIVDSPVKGILVIAALVILHGATR